MPSHPDDWRTADADALLDALLALADRDEAAAFLRDLCTLGFPTEPHRRARHDRDVAAGYILFCKHFELEG